MRPIVDGLQADFDDQVRFLRLDAAGEGHAAFTAFGLRGHPAYVILDTGGKVLWQDVGVRARGRLESSIRQSLGEG